LLGFSLGPGAGSELCLVYPLARGGNLEDRLLRSPAGLERLAMLGCVSPPPLAWQRRVRILRDVVRALIYLHKEASPQVLHRDVKPSNVLIDADGTALLSDVGTATVAEAHTPADMTHRSTTVVRGTPGYLDPLISNALQHSEMTDGYATAITVLVTLVGRPAVGLKEECRHLLRNPDRPERWQPPGVPDVTAGGWPDGVAGRLADTVAGLTEEYKVDRMPLTDALRVRQGHELPSISARLIHDGGHFPQ
jgi:serine/threonine protein kinase